MNFLEIFVFVCCMPFPGIIRIETFLICEEKDKAARIDLKVLQNDFRKTQLFKKVTFSGK